MTKKLLLDTQFFIDLLNVNSVKKQNAIDFLDYFEKEGYQIGTSSIVVSEFWNSSKQLTPFENVSVFTFSQKDGIVCAEINEKLAKATGRFYNKDVKNCVTNDYMLLSQCYNNQLTFVTRDGRLTEEIDLLEKEFEIVIPYIKFNETLQSYIGSKKGMKPLF